MHVVLVLGVDIPNPLAVGNADAVQQALRPEDIDAVLVHDRAGPRAGAVTVEVVVIGFVLELPDQLAGLGIATGQPVVVPKAVEVEQPPPADHGRGVSEAHLGFPDHPEAVLGPFGEYAGLGGFVVGGRAEEPMPVNPLGSGAQVGGDLGRRLSGTADQADQHYQASSHGCHS